MEEPISAGLVVLTVGRLFADIKTASTELTNDYFPGLSRIPIAVPGHYGNPVPKRFRRTAPAASPTAVFSRTGAR
jgi:hypothetical protein